MPQSPPSAPRSAPTDPAPLTELAAPVHSGHAKSDTTPHDLERLNTTLRTAGIDHTSEIHPGTTHGFIMIDTDASDPAGPRRHWDRLLALLDRTLATG